MIGYGLCLLLGLACAEAELPPGETTLALSAPMIAVPAIAGPAVEGPAAQMPDAFPADCEVAPPIGLRKHFVDAARAHPPATACQLAKQAFCESSFDVAAVSPAKARGLMQFRDPTAAELGIDPLDPRQAVFGAARYIAWQRAGWTPPDFAGRTGTDIEGLGLGGYNWGRRHMYADQRRHGWELLAEAMPHLPAETQGYIRCGMTGRRG